MGEDEVLRCIHYWLYDVDRYLRSHLDALKDDLASEDKIVHAQAAREVLSILDWLYPPRTPLSPDARVERTAAAMLNDELTPEEKLAAGRRALRSTGRPRGRPRDETSQHAIQALTLRYATSMSWRKMALEVRGCAHRRPHLNLSCEACGQAIRNAANRLEAFLQSIGFDRDFPKGKMLDEASQRALLRLVKESKSDRDPL